MNDLAIFNYNDTAVRTVVIDGEPWFVLADLCNVLSISDVSIVRRRLDDALCQTHPIVDSLGRTQQATVVSEPGMYEVVIRSDKAEAVTFRRWITGEVLPQLRRNGMYSVAPLSLEEQTLQVLTALTSKVDAQRAELEAAAPKVEAFDHLMDSNGLYTMEACAKALGYGRNVFFRDLRRLGILQGNNLPYQRYAHHFKVIPGTYVNRKTGETVPTATTWVQPKGLEFLRRKTTDAVAAVALGVPA